jgi:dihydroorotase-like cyclic amidohydrolase
MPLDAFARFSSTNAARTIGLYPRKGTILPGSDADLALYDLEHEWTVDAKRQQHSKNPWSPFDGRTSRARCVRTLVRGMTVHRDGEIVAPPGTGRFLSVHDDFAAAPVAAAAGATA